MGNISVSTRVYGGAGNMWMVQGKLALSTSYATGGDSYTAALFGLATLNALLIRSESTGRIYSADTASAKILAKNNAAPTITTVTNAAPVAVGTNAGALTQVAGAAGITGVQAPAISEVAATTDLSATSVEYLAWGW